MCNCLAPREKKLTKKRSAGNSRDNWSFSPGNPLIDWQSEKNGEIIVVWWEIKRKIERNRSISYETSQREKEAPKLWSATPGFELTTFLDCESSNCLPATQPRQDPGLRRKACSDKSCLGKCHREQTQANWGEMWPPLPMHHRPQTYCNHASSILLHFLYLYYPKVCTGLSIIESWQFFPIFFFF